MAKQVPPRKTASAAQQQPPAHTAPSEHQGPQPWWRAIIFPHLVIILGFLVIAFGFLSPVLSGKRLKQNDVTQWQGSYEEVRDYQEKTGERSLWTNSMFGGMPTYQIAPYSPNSMIGTAYTYDVLVSRGLPLGVNSVFLYLFGMYFLLLAFRVNPWVAALGAIAYAFSSYNIIIIEAGHMLKTYALGTAPLVFAAMIYILRWRKYWLGGALFTLALAVHLRANHVQISYYFGLILLVFLIFETVRFLKAKQVKHMVISYAVIAAGAIIAVGSGISFLMTTYEYGEQTIRGKSELTSTGTAESSGLDREYAFQWSNGVGESFTVLIPNIYGGASGKVQETSPSALKAVDDLQVRNVVGQMDAYWGDQPFTSGPVYFGAVIMFLFVLGLFFLKGTDRWWILIAAILGVLLAMGRNFPALSYFMFDYFPLYNKFRSVNMTMVISSLVIPILAALVVNKLITTKIAWDKESRNKLIYSLAITAGLSLIFWLVPSLAGNFLKPNDGDAAMLKQAQFPPDQIPMILPGLADARVSILKSDALRSFLFIALAGALIFFYFRQKVKIPVLVGGLLLLIFIDLVAVDKRHLTADKFEKKSSTPILPSAADNAILQDTDPNYRVLNLTVSPFNDATTSYFHKSVGGYHGAKLRRFQEMRAAYLDQAVAVMQQNLKGGFPPASLLTALQTNGDLGILNMLNTRYFIVGPSAAPLKNPYALGNAWFIKGFYKVQSADAEIAALERFNPADTAVVNVSDERFAGFANKSFEIDPAAEIKLTSYAPNHLTYSTNASSPQVAVFSEIYYNDGLGWHAYIDGQPAEHYRVNYVLRAMHIPAGKHTIEFKFDPPTFNKGENLSLLFSILLILALAAGIGHEVWEHRKQQRLPVNA